VTVRAHASAPVLVATARTDIRTTAVQSAGDELERRGRPAVVTGPPPRAGRLDRHMAGEPLASGGAVDGLAHEADPRRRDGRGMCRGGQDRSEQSGKRYEDGEASARRRRSTRAKVPLWPPPGSSRGIKVACYVLATLMAPR
jgi:hypothetical protein